MQAHIIDIRTALLQSGKEEFLAYGFEKASLRKICKNAGVTTGAFYSYFNKKEDLFSGLVDPMLQDFYKMYDTVVTRELNDLDCGESSEIEAILFLSTRKDVFKLLFDCAAGTKYEGFKEKFLNTVLAHTFQTFFDSYAKKNVNPALVRVIAKMKFEEYMELIYGDYSMDQMKQIVAQVAVFTQAGFAKLIEEMNDSDT